MGAACVSGLRGGVLSGPESEKSRQIDRDLLMEKKKKILKILLLGPGESGKSTTLKQMKIIHAEGYSREDLMSKRNVIYDNAVRGLVKAVHDLHEKGIPLPLDAQAEADVITKYAEHMRNQDVFPLSPQVADSMSRLYLSPSIQALIHKTDDSVVDEAARYFLDNLERVRAPDYIPTLQDVLKSRVATQGCIQMSFFIKEFTFNVYDVGGQRSQRKKWLHIFDNVHAVLFITSLSEYTQTLAEDPTVNRMRESLNLFGGICKNEIFIHTAIILFLNKIDLFEERIQKHPITTVFPRYKGGQTMDESLAHITKRFLRENTNSKRTIYVHNTCATDTQQIQVVIDSVIDVIIQQTMQKIGIQ